MSMINALHETMQSEARSEQHPGNAVFLSPVSIWEALVKFATVDPAVRAYPVPSC